MREGAQLFRRLVQGEVTVDQYVDDVKRRVQIALDCREMARKHRRGRPIAFGRRRRP